MRGTKRLPAWATPLVAPDVSRPDMPLQLARLLALSHGEAALTRERWAAMQALEGRRLQRLKGGA